jgi:hypothetical protein
LTLTFSNINHLTNYCIKAVPKDSNPFHHEPDVLPLEGEYKGVRTHERLTIEAENGLDYLSHTRSGIFCVVENAEDMWAEKHLNRLSEYGQKRERKANQADNVETEPDQMEARDMEIFYLGRAYGPADLLVDGETVHGQVCEWTPGFANCDWGLIVDGKPYR